MRRQECRIKSSVVKVFRKSCPRLEYTCLCSHGFTCCILVGKPFQVCLMTKGTTMDTHRQRINLSTTKEFNGFPKGLSAYVHKETLPKHRTHHGCADWVLFGRVKRTGNIILDKPCAIGQNTYNILVCDLLRCIVAINMKHIK